MRFQNASGQRRCLAIRHGCGGGLSSCRAIAAMLLFAICGSPIGAPPQSAEPNDEIQRILDDAIGYGSVWNVEKAEDLADRVLAKTDDPEMHARAHWVKAVAYLYFQVEYRTNRLRDKIEAEKDTLRRLKPELLGDDIARLEATLPFHLPGRPGIEAIVKRAREDLLPPRDPEKPRPFIEENLLSTPISIYQLGRTYWLAAQQLKETSPTTSRVYYARARRMHKKAMEMRPDSYEFAAYYVTLLAEMGRKDEAERVGKRVLDKFEGKIRYPMVGDRGPFLLHAAVISQSDPYKSWDLVERRAQTPKADAWVHFVQAQYLESRATTDSEKVEIWDNLARRMEEGEIKTPGAILYARAKTYYRLAHMYARIGAFDKSLKTYEKLAESSPHYAEIHYNKAICLWLMADKEKEPETALRLLTRACDEIEQQLNYNWHGNETARNYLGKLREGLEEHRKGSKTSAPFREGIDRLIRRLEKLGAKQINKSPED